MSLKESFGGMVSQVRGGLGGRARARLLLAALLGMESVWASAAVQPMPAACLASRRPLQLDSPRAPSRCRA